MTGQGANIVQMDIDVRNGGESAIKNHAAAKKHTKRSPPKGSSLQRIDVALEEKRVSQPEHINESVGISVISSH